MTDAYVSENKVSQEDPCPIIDTFWDKKPRLLTAHQDNTSLIQPKQVRADKPLSTEGFKSRMQTDIWAVLPWSL